MGGRGKGKGRNRGRGRGDQDGEEEEFPQLGGLRIDTSVQEQAPVAPSWPRRGSTLSAPKTTPQEIQHSTPTEWPSRPSSSSSSASTSAPTIWDLMSSSRAPTTPKPAISNSALAKVKFPARKKPGTNGTEMIACSNHLEITLGKRDLFLTEYDVAMKLISDKDGSLKECPKKYFKRGLHAYGKKVWPDRHPAFDGSKLLFSCGKKLIDEPVTRDVTVRNEERYTERGQAEKAKLRITVKEVNSVSLSVIDEFMNNEDAVQFPQLAIQAIDVILRNSGMNRFVSFSRSFYFPPPNPKSLGLGIDLWHGVFQSSTLGVGKIFLNVDVAHKGFPRAQSVRDLVADLATGQSKTNQAPFNPESDYHWGTKRSIDDQLRNYIKGLKVEYEIPNLANSKRVYRVNEIVAGPATQKFMQEGLNGQKKEITVSEYFAKEKKYKIRYPNWPCLHVGNKDKNILVPMELCRVAPNQVTIKKLNDDQTKSMVKEAATEPKVRQLKILEAFKSLNVNQDPILKEFQIEVHADMTEVKGRVLAPPALKYRTDQHVRVINGEWRMDNQKFQSVTKEVRNWAILDLCQANRDIPIIRSQLVTNANSLGLIMSDKPKILRSDQKSFHNLSDLIRFLENQALQGPFDLVVVLIPDFIAGQSPYAAVKQVLEMKHKILTQCIRQRTLRKFEKSTVFNILLKINAKLDGRNHSIHKDSRPPCFSQNVMIMGADVTHPPPESKSCPSVAAVTASHDKEDVFKFNMQWRLQPPRVEEILDMENITLAHLKFYASKNGGKFPSRIIFYRDGVSDGQFAMVLTCELAAIKKALKAIGQTYNPKITFLVVQKRHHTRFFPNKNDKLADKGNVPAGFVVDNTITHPKDMDFYLVSHQSIQGTSRPTKYKVLYDDADMSEDQVEQLTFYLCHLYTRCNRSVSYPAPTYYAHLAAFRAKHYYNEGRSTIDVNNEKALNLESTKLNNMMSTFMKNHPMFFV
ncbi:protein argonaute-2-like [Cloeon dipterum]|uniref:protein argonaute-2-like n=1 Tax=Cloeon dipterum TaxID=197152 RepID=UPI00321FBEA2